LNTSPLRVVVVVGGVWVVAAVLVVSALAQAWLLLLALRTP